MSIGTPFAAMSDQQLAEFAAAHHAEFDALVSAEEILGKPGVVFERRPYGFAVLYRKAVGCY